LAGAQVGAEARERVRLDVFGVRGARIRTLADGVFEPGAHQITWDGRDPIGQRVRPGTYFVRLETPSGRLVRQIIRVR
jgi:flagellar hook assembly protein FlgD